MINKYLEQLKTGKLQLEKLEEEVYFVLNEPASLTSDMVKFLNDMLSAIRALSESIKKQNKPEAKENLNTLITMLDSMTLEFFNVLKEKEEIDEQLTNKYKLTEEEIMKVFKTNEQELNHLKEALKKTHSEFDFGFL